ncbi:endonuclease/exonuclease/phosphatase family protein [Spirosoma rhododendri]|uniref:Endonuclease/exonuclease/phosphatase family protein n=1 Tax=Spirosoma rhododendri TaxID=2728024 RepID=A0A7L5DT66_9BACT|nr:endonuclease/exonuclease/phosphatase family protein [Spirosoma rhododendri]QJD81659.1 endonuclease/exonuclease/phosphatase family protein [Spirosoma rhododendri]
MTTLQRALFYLLLLAGGLLSALTWTSLINNSSLWFLQVLNFPRLAMLLALMSCLLLFLLLPHGWTRATWLFLASLLLSIGIQAYILFPYSSLAPTVVETVSKAAVSQQATFSILVANVWIDNRHAQELLSIIATKQPTFVLTMEVNQWWVHQLDGLGKEYPYCIKYPTRNAYGMALYAKLPLDKPTIRFLHHRQVPSFTTTITLPNKRQFQLWTLHPVAPFPSQYPTNIGGKEVALLRAGRLIAQQAQPTVVAGDFNDVGWSPNTTQFAAISGLRDVRRGRGMYSTFDARSLLLRWPLDYVFVSSQFKVLAVERLAAFGSDHFPYYVALAYQPGLVRH